MKIKLFLCLCVLAAITACTNNAVKISGTLDSPTLGEYIFLDELKSDRLEPVDSVKIGDGGSYNFKFEIEQPSFYLVRFSQANFLTLVLEPGEKITLHSHHDSLNYPSVVKGSKGTEKIVEYNNVLRTAINNLKGLNETYMKNIENPNLPAVIDSLDKVADGYLTGINKYTKDYIDSNIGSLITLIALYQQVAPAVPVLNPSKDLEYYVKVDSALFKLFPAYEPVISLHNQVQQLSSNVMQSSPETAEAGEKASLPEISLPTPAGDTVRLSSTKGSVVLLDFWASWCAPCRLESPNLVKAYDKYHRKGFQIYQVSLDKTKEAWMKGIEDDKLGRWIHVSDIMYWNSPVAKLYKIESIPANFLLDKEGRVIAKDLRGEELMTKLSEVFGK
jgi:thiol-disulfide isomerase/thioredoxin